jgi:hypothetical protein
MSRPWKIEVVVVGRKYFNSAGAQAVLGGGELRPTSAAELREALADLADHDLLSPVTEQRLVRASFEQWADVREVSITLRRLPRPTEPPTPAASG